MKRTQSSRKNKVGTKVAAIRHDVVLDLHSISREESADKFDIGQEGTNLAIRNTSDVENCFEVSVSQLIVRISIGLHGSDDKGEGLFVEEQAKLIVMQGRRIGSMKLLRQ